MTSMKQPYIYYVQKGGPNDDPEIQRGWLMSTWPTSIIMLGKTRALEKGGLGRLVRGDIYMRVSHLFDVQGINQYAYNQLVISCCI